MSDDDKISIGIARGPGDPDIYGYPGEPPIEITGQDNGDQPF